MTQVSSSGENPYVSIVITGRNDNYCGDFNDRLQLSVNWLNFLTNKYHLNAELVVVNYNPLLDQPGLEEIISWPKSPSFLKVKLVTVTSEFHKLFTDPKVRKTVPLFEFIAKNIGIIRAKGQFILSTNADILISEKLFEFIAGKTLEKKTLYRADRLDFSAPQTQEDLQNLEKRIRKNVFMFYMKGGLIRQWQFPKNLAFKISALRIYNRFRAFYYKSLPYRLVLKRIPFLPVMKEEHLHFFDHHCTASGDFCLMSQQDWLGLRGYPQDTWTNLHVDSLLVISAAVSGIRIMELPWPVYHQAHRKRFDYDGYSMEGPMGERLEKEALQMLNTGRPILYNNKNWGLKTEKLPEKTL